MSYPNSSNCAKRKVKDVTSNTEILSVTNPEIFDISPRPGGFLKVMVPTKSQDYIAVDESPTCDVLGSSVGVSFRDRTTASRTSRTSRGKSHLSIMSTASKAPRHIEMIVPETPSREFRLSRAIMETDWDVTAVDETNTVVGISNPLQDSINMLAVTVTTVMLLAAKLDVTEEYLTWAEEYLMCFKDENGMYPPNIDGMLTEISKKRCDCQKKCADELEECETDTPKKGAKKKSSSASPKPSKSSKSPPATPPSQKSSPKPPSSPKSSSSSKSPPKTRSKSSSKKGSSSPKKPSSDNEQDTESQRKKSSKSPK